MAFSKAWREGVSIIVYLIDPVRWLLEVLGGTSILPSVTPKPFVVLYIHLLFEVANRPVSIRIVFVL